MSISIIGDTHYDLQGLQKQLHDQKSLQLSKHLCHLGDFGLTELGLRTLRSKRIRFGRPLYLIDGNHDDYRWWHDESMCRQLAQRHNIHLVKRGDMLLIDGLRVLCCGGSFSVHEAQRPGPFSNVIQDGDIQRCKAALEEHGGCDLMLSHSSPAGIGLRMKSAPEYADDAQTFITDAGFSMGDNGDLGEPKLTKLWQFMQDNSYQPQAWYYGHWHQHRSCKIKGVSFSCLAQSHKQTGIALTNLKDAV